MSVPFEEHEQLLFHGLSMDQNFEVVLELHNPFPDHQSSVGEHGTVAEQLEENSTHPNELMTGNSGNATKK